MSSRNIFIVALIFCLTVSASLKSAECEAAPAGKTIQLASLDQCIDMALQHNQQRRISVLAVKIATHQYAQAVSAYWPKLVASSLASRMNDDPVLILPEETVVYQIDGMELPDLSIPGVGTIPGAAVPAQDVAVTLPEQKITLRDRDNIVTSLEMNWPVYAGGKRSALLQQSEANIAAARQSARRTDLQIMYDVKRMYYGVILSENLCRVAQQAVVRLNVTTDLTEQLYQGGSGTVTKADYLKSRTMAESARAIMLALEGNREVAKAALANTMGLSWDTEVRLSETDIPCRQWETSLADLIGSIYEFNPDWKRLQAVIAAARAKIKAEKAGHMPRLMLTGTLWRVDNHYDYGLVNDQNDEGWKIGIGFQLPIFEGFLVSQKVKEAEVYSEKLEGQRILLKEGIALQIKHGFLLMNSYLNQTGAVKSAMESAAENRALNERAYEAGLVETQDVIESQIMESMMQARYYHIVFKHAETQFLIEKLIGKAIQDQVYHDRINPQ